MERGPRIWTRKSRVAVALPTYTPMFLFAQRPTQAMLVDRSRGELQEDILEIRFALLEMQNAVASLDHAGKELGLGLMVAGELEVKPTLACRLYLQDVRLIGGKPGRI